MSKKKAITLMVVAVLITNIITFGVTSISTGSLDLGMSFNNENRIKKSQELSKVQSIKNYVKNNYLREVDDEKLLEGQLKGMVQSLNDPYSVYMTQDEFANFAQETAGIYGGIGVIVTPGEDNLITVVSPIEDTPGERAGIKTGDRIIKVNGVEYSAEKMDEAVKVMKGKPKTKVTITIMRLDKEGNNQILDLDLIREEIRLVTVKSNIIDNNIGYIRITSFDELTYKDFKENLSKLEKSNIKGLIIDLRNNPGGLLNVCADIADELLGAGDIVYTQTKDGTREYLKSDKNQITIPLVLLVNEGSASASEILAGAVKDHQRGELIGTKTFGKGIVQKIRELPDGSGIKLTVSEYFTPNGINIHGIGITPDIVIELNEDAENIGPEYIKEDNQLQRALEVIKGKI